MNALLVFGLLIGISLASTPIPTTVQIRNPLECIKNYDPSVDYFPDKSDPYNAEMFDIEYYKSFKILSNKIHFNTYVLYQCGTPKPGSDPNVPIPRDLPSDAKFFEIPLGKGMALPDTTMITFIELLGLRHLVKYVSPYYSSPCFKKMVANGDVLLWPNPKPTDFAYEFGWGERDNDTKFISAASLTSDNDSLGRAEWIKFIAAFFNLEELANIRFSTMRDRYLCHRSTINGQYATNPRPVVMWISYSSWPTTRVPRYLISTSEWIYDFLEDAGGDPKKSMPKSTFFYGTDPNTGIKYNDLKDFHETLKQADVIFDGGLSRANMQAFINVFRLNEVDDYQNVFKFLKNEQVYTLDGLQGGSGIDWWEGMLPEPDVLLEDIIEVLYPQYQNHTRVWVRNLAKGENFTVTDATQCVSTIKPAVLRANCCGNKYCPMDITVEPISFPDQVAEKAGTGSLELPSILLLVLVMFLLWIHEA